MAPPKFPPRGSGVGEAVTDGFGDPCGVSAAGRLGPARGVPNAMKALQTYLSGLTVTQGRLAGRPFTVLPWQRRFLRAAFRPGIHSASLSISRGNGKTALLSGIAAATLDGPLMVPRGETVIVASSFEQARIAFEHVLAFMGDKLADRDRWRIWDTAQQARVEDKATGARVRCIGSDPRRAHGLAPVLVLADEPAQWPETTGERMVAALRTASGKQPHSRFVALGTRPADDSHWFSKMLAGGCDYAQSHAAEPDEPPFRKRTWAKANPSMAHMPDLEAAIRTEAAEARTDGAMLAAFRALRLNLGTSDTQQSVLLEASTWQRIEGLAEVDGAPVWGLDLGTSNAMSAVAAYWPATGRLEALAAFPSEPSLAERGLSDGVGRLYTECEARNELIVTGGAAVDIGQLLHAALATFGAPTAIAADRWREAELRDALKAAGVPLARLELRGQGFRDGGEDVRDFRRSVAEGRVTPIPSLLLTAAMAEARCVVDPAGNAKLAKNTEGGRRARAKDDAAAAGILAVAVGCRASRKPSGGVYLGAAG